MNNRRVLLLLFAASLGLSACDSMPSWMGGKKAEKEKLAGERIAVLPVTTELQPDPVLKNVAVTLPSLHANSDWTQHGGLFSATNANLAGSGFDSVASAAAGSGNAYEHTLVVTPVVGGGMVFAMDGVGTISAHDVADIGKVTWQNKGVAEVDDPDTIGGGLAYDAGRLYAASGRGVVAAFDAATGKELWRKPMHVSFRSAPKVSGGKLFIITIDNQLFALNAATGEVAWNHRGISETAGLMNSVSPTVAGDMVVVPYSSGEIYVLAVADGKEIWSDSLSAGKRSQAAALFAGIGGDPVVDENVIFSVSSGGMVSVQSLMAGQKVWDRPIGGHNTPWVAGDNLFLLTGDNVLIDFVKFDGHIHWATQLATYADPTDKKDAISWKGPVLVDGKLAVVGSNGQLLLISAQDGTITATKPIPEDIYTAPVVAGGKMYLVGQDAKLYQLK